MIENREELKHQIALLEIEKVGPSNSRKLIEYFGSAKEVFMASPKDFDEFGVLGNSVRNGITNEGNLEFAEAQLQFCEAQSIEVLSYYNDERYPKRLKHCHDAPLIIYKKGNSDLNHVRMVAIVGTRQCSDYGRNFCAKIVEELKKYGAYIVSGLAFGIDHAAHHQAVLNDLDNVAVLAHGHDRIYPSEHRQISEEIVKKGALVTEFPIHTNPDRENFPKRNRIVAGMVDAVIVVESSIKGGSMITAKLGNDYNREVFALPGRYMDETAQGCNHLIKTNQANLISSIKDIGYILGWEEKETKKKKVVQKQLFVDLNETEQVLYDLLSKDTKNIDELVVTSGLSISNVSTDLLMMEFKGIVKQLPGKVYQLC